MCVSCMHAGGLVTIAVKTPRQPLNFSNPPPKFNT